MKRTLIIIIVIAGILGVVYISGPHPAEPVYATELPGSAELKKNPEDYLINREAALPVKPGNNAEIIWADDSVKNPTDHVIIYLHGFGGSHEEGNPVHRNIARKYGCNLLLTRLSDHGLVSREPLSELTVDRLWNSALEYYAIGKELGDKVIIMSTSTGGTLALKMAAEFPGIAALILYSPNIEVNETFAWILDNPWGLQFARLNTGGKYLVSDNKEPYYNKYWYDHYRLEAVTELQELIETSMTGETFQQVQQPVLLLYYYKDEENQDDVVRVDAMLDMFDDLGTADNMKMKRPVPEAGDHVIACSLRSGGVETVEQYTEEYMQDILGISLQTSERGSRH